jgi:hypothetical protein
MQSTFTSLRHGQEAVTGTKICNGKDVTAGSAKISDFEEHTGVDSRNVLGDSISRIRDCDVGEAILPHS